MRRDSSFCAKSVRYNIFTNDAPYEPLNSVIAKLIDSGRISYSV